MTAALIALLLLIVLAASAAIVLTRSPSRQVFAMAANGAALSVLFMALQAPDVAYSEIVVGTVALPLFFLAALAALRAEESKSSGGDRERAS